MGLPLFQVDAFTDQPFQGNPAAVCILPEPRDEPWMQNVAAEMNLAETAFLQRQPDGFRLRWFTPAIEVDLCGHATLASAHLLWQEGYLEPNQPARFHTRSGLLTATQQGKWINLDFPANPPEAVAAPPGLLEALGTAALHVEKHRLHYLVEVASEEILKSIQPDFRALAKIKVRGTIVTCRPASGPYDFVSRYFAPAAGVDEDPVTGSAHCCLGPYWQRKLKKDEFLAYQASRRGGVVRVHMKGERVLLGGQAVTVLRGELC
jgi:PhzF family phenazine biosynthesis protein